MRFPFQRSALRRKCAAVLLSVFASSVLHAATLETTVDVPPLALREQTLPNGLQVVSVEDHASPTVSIQVWYRVGSKDDPEHRSGFAHLFEHLMFKSTLNLASEQFDRLTEDVGGMNNAFTSDDVTAYFEVVPANHLERLLWAEAERMSNLDVTQANFESERAVVEEEFRSRVLAAPYGQFEYALQSQSFTTHPYKRPTIGSIEDLENASLADVQAFHRTYYRPDNATLIVVGDFSPAQLDTWVARYFGRIEWPAGDIPRVSTVEPVRGADRRVVVRAPNVPLPALGLTWLAPPGNSADVPALKVALAVLAGGEASRFYQALVYRQQLAQDVGFYYSENADAGVLVATAVLANGKQPAEAERALLAEIDHLRSAPIKLAELQRAKTRLLTSALASRETNEGKGIAIGSALTQTGAVAAVNTELVQLQAVTAEDVQRVLKNYVIARHKVVVEYPGDASNTAQADAKGGAQ